MKGKKEEKDQNEKKYMVTKKNYMKEEEDRNETRKQDKNVAKALLQPLDWG